MQKSTDVLKRPLRSLRLSVTDRCDFRCNYCMPEDQYVWLEKKHLLTVSELEQVAGVFLGMGVRKVRLTGGEPLLRPEILDIAARLRELDSTFELTMTTNGSNLAKMAQSLREAGLDRLSISLDTLRPDRFEKLTRRHEFGRVLEGIDAVVEAGFRNTKINTVVMRDFNQDELPEMLEFGHRHGIEIRFIEYMDVGGATRWTPGEVFTKTEILKTIETAFGTIVPLNVDPSAPARTFELPNGQVFGVISSVTEPFCRECDRVRLTADGTLFSCLYAVEGHDLRKVLRAGASRQELEQFIRSIWNNRDDKGAEDRLTFGERTAFIPQDQLKLDPLLEMHTRGG